MARIVISSHGTTDDVVPFIPLAKRLRQRGHSVLVAVNEALQPLFRNAGLEVVNCGARLGPEELQGFASLFDQWRPVPEAAQRLAQFNDVERNYQDLLGACGKADLLIAASSQHAAALV